MKILCNDSIKKITEMMLDIVWILRSTSASHTFFVANSFLFAPDLNYGCPIIDPALLPAQPIFWVRLDILKTFYSFFYSCYTGVLGQKHIILVADTHMLISSHPDCNVHAQLRSVAISSIMAKIGMNKTYPFKNRICKWEFFCYLDLS